MIDLGIEFFDIAFKENQIWYAVDDPAQPVQVFNSSGTMVYSISSSVIPAAHGMTFDSDGYLWVADADADKIYQVDIPLGIEEGEGSSARPGLTALGNPFSASVTLQLTGFDSSAQLNIFDLSGRTVLSQPVAGSFVWNGTDGSGSRVPAGTYMAVVQDGEGFSASARLVRLD